MNTNHERNATELRWCRPSILVLCVFLATGCANVGDDAQSIGQAVNDLGFTQVYPPTTLSPPGTVVWVQGDQTFTSGVVCTQDNALGEGLDVRQAPTLTAEWRNKASAGMTLGGTFTQKLNAELGGTYLKDVALRLTNAVVLELDDAQVLDHAASHDPSPGCLAAIGLRREEGATLSIVRSVLKADVEFTLSYDTGTTAEAKAEVSERIRANLSGSAKVTRDDSIVAKNTFIGVKDDALLFRGFMQANGSPLLGAGPDGSERAMTSDGLVAFTPDH